MNEALEDRCLEKYSLFIIDEFHEKDIYNETLLILVVHLMRSRKDVKLVVMSGTKNPRIVSWLFDTGFSCEVISVPGQPFHLDIETLSIDNYKIVMAAKIRELASSPRCGSILAFWPTVKEVLEALEDQKKYMKDMSIYPVAFFRDSDTIGDVMAPRRKVINATNIAESSLTLPNIGAVVDSSRERKQCMVDGLPALKLGPISEQQAEQRGKRAGRTGDGVCYRCPVKYSQDDKLMLETSDAKEWALMFKYLGICLPDPFVSANMVETDAFLHKHDLIDASGFITADGKLATKLQCGARWGSAIIRSIAEQCLPEVITMAAFSDEFEKIIGNEEHKEYIKEIFDKRGDLG